MYLQLSGIDGFKIDKCSPLEHHGFEGSEVKIVALQLAF